jgi:hypothetical protein
LAHRRKSTKRPRKPAASPQQTPAQPSQSIAPEPVQKSGWTLPDSLERFRPGWDRLQRELAKGDRLIAALQLPKLPGRAELILGPNALFWMILLAIAPIVYVGFGLTVSVTGWGWPRDLYPWIDNDYWWHLATGDYIIDEREMPSPDPWLFTYDGKFVAHEWLGEVFLSVTDRIGDYPAGIIATVIIASLGFWILVAAMHRYGLSWRACTILTTLWMGVFLRDGVFAVRPQMWTFSFYALLFLFIALYETGRWRQLWVLPPFFLLWWNVHLSAVIGIVAFGLFGLDQVIRRKPIRHLLIVGVLSLAGMVVNPFGLDYIDQIVRFGARPEIWNERIFEWQPPDFSQGHNLGFALSIPMVVPAVWQLLRGRVWPGGMILFFLYQALTSVRFVTVYVLFCMIFAGWLVWQHRQDYRAVRVPAERPAKPPLWVLAAPVAVAAAIVLWVATSFDNSQFQREPFAWGYPVDAATLYEEQYADLRLFNTYDWGGYLIYRFRGDPQIFIDGRADTYPNELLEQYFHMVDGDAGWDAMMNQYDIDVIVVRPIDGLTQAIEGHPDWELIYQDTYSNMYLRRSAT